MAANYVLDRMPEIERLEHQARLIGADRVTDHLDLGPGAAVLDAGSGTGWVSRLIARTYPDAQVTGVDITPHFVAHARALAARDELDNLTYEVGDICALPFEAAQFDLVWSQLVVFFLPHPSRAMAEFARVLRPGGRVKVIVTDGVFETIWPARPAMSAAVQSMRDSVLHGWRLARVPAMLRAAGLTDITVRSDVDRVYTFLGGASPEQRRNIEESYLHAIRIHPDLVGGADAAARLAAEVAAFMDDPESTSISTHWTFTATRP